MFYADGNSGRSETFLGRREAVVHRHRLNVVGELAAAWLLVRSPDGVTKYVLRHL